MIRLLIVAEIRLYRDGLAESLSRRPEFAVVGTARDAETALQLAAELTPDVIVMDRTMRHSLRALRGLCNRYPAMAAVAIGVQDREDDVLACAEAGVGCYVPRDASLEELIHAITSAARGETVCSPQMMGALVRQLASRHADGQASFSRRPLTAREAEIVALLGQHLSNKEIARRLGIEVATVKNHVHNALEKLAVRRRGDVAARMQARDPWRSHPEGVPFRQF